MTTHYTADGQLMYVGMPVFRINTRDCARTWFVTRHVVKEIKECGCSIDPDDGPFPGAWYSTQGHNRFYADEGNADVAARLLMAEYAQRN